MNTKELESLKNELLAEEGLILSADKIIEQIKIFKRGIPFVRLLRPCVIGDGVKVISKAEQESYINKYFSALNEGRVIKFVPASGAATRMFKKQLSVLVKYENSDFQEIKQLAEKGDEDCKAAVELFENIHRFAFYNELEQNVEKSGKKIGNLIDNENVSELIRFVTENIGLNYANLPKGCILFHSYPKSSRTAFEEHLVEAMDYAADKNKVIKVHFTISPEHEAEINKLFHALFEKYSEQGWKFDVGFSFQSPSTDTVSVTQDNKLFRDQKGKIVFRPGGHGALLKNLNDLKADIVSIKNIDNIVPDHLRTETYNYKKILGGYLVFLQEKVFGFLRNLERETISESIITEILEFIKNEFEMDLSENLKAKPISDKGKYLFYFLNRPLRVCGMVKRENHPGGSPFWVENENGETTKQVIETAQVDLLDNNQLKILDEASHFSPVDFICGVKDYNDSYFNLEKFTNPGTGLITTKSKDGKELKALELPGLWNGGMYYWLTVFVEVPKITFNPVKEVNDLLKPEHQPFKT
jgi:hypothetical protein